MALTRRQLLFGAAGTVGAVSVGGLLPRSTVSNAAPATKPRRETVVDAPPLAPPPIQAETDDPSLHVITPIVAHAGDEPLPPDAAARVQTVIDQMNGDLLARGKRTVRYSPVRSEPLALEPSDTLLFFGADSGTIGGVSTDAAQKLFDGASINVVHQRYHVFYFGPLRVPEGAAPDDVVYGFYPDDSPMVVSAMDLHYDDRAVHDRFPDDEAIRSADSFTTHSRAFVALHELMHLLGANHTEAQGDLMTPVAQSGLPTGLDIDGRSYWTGNGNKAGRYASRSVLLAAPEPVQSRLEATWKNNSAFTGRLTTGPYEHVGGWVMEGTAGAAVATKKGDFCLLGEFHRQWTKDRSIGVPVTKPEPRRQDDGTVRYVQSFTAGEISVTPDGLDPVVSRTAGVGLER